MSLLPEWHSLVVAAVDGEITSSERRKLREILKTNRQARELLREYREQAKLLSRAKSPPLPCDFASAFRNEPEIRNGNKQADIAPPMIVKDKKAFRDSVALASWVALALSLLMVLGVGYTFLSQTPNNSAFKGETPAPNQSKSDLSKPTKGKVSVASASPTSLPSEKALLTQPEGALGPINPKDFTSKDMLSTNAPSKESNPIGLASSGKEIPKPAQGSGEPATTSTPKFNSSESALLTAPYSDAGTLVESSISVPAWISWDKPQLEPNLKISSKTLLLEIPCNDSIVVSNQLIQILKNQKKGVLVDRLAQDRLIQKNIRSHFGFCLENVSQTDLEKLLVSLKSDVENLKNKTALPPLGKGVALFPAETELPPVFQFPHTLEKPSGQLSDLKPNPNLSKSPGKPNEGIKKLLQPTLNTQGKVDALVLAQSPYYPEVRSSSASQEISLYRKLKSSTDSQKYRVIIFIRQLHL